MSRRPTLSELMLSWGQHCEACPEKWPRVGLLVRLSDFSGSDKDWMLDFRAMPLVGPWPIRSSERPDCEIRVSAEHLEAIGSGELSPQKAFLDGTLRAAGTRDSVLKLNPVFDALRKLTVWG